MAARLREVEPRLPQELECVIFKGAALEWAVKDASTLLLVAKRVNDWIRPLIYRVFNQARVPKFPDFENHPSIKIEDVGKFAKHLLAGYHCNHINLLLSSCTNVHNLALWYDIPLSQHLEAIRNLPLTHFSVTIVGTTVQELLRPPFPNLTHLEIFSFGPRASWDQCSVIMDLPRLSHLAIVVENSNLASLFLLHCEHLRVLMVLGDEDEEDSWAGDSAYLSSIEDVRLVLMLSDFLLESEKDWIDGANGKVNTWITAELYSRARKDNFLCISSQIWIRSPFDWDEALNPQGKEWYSALPIF